MAATILTRRALATAFAAIGLATAGAAHAWADPVDLRIVDRETGRVLPIWRHAGRLYVAGRPGGRYALRVRNDTGGRMLVVMSVDGVNILSGETAGWDQRGCIFGPLESYDISGWRKSETQVAAFTFSPLPQSYAARTGRPAEVGVIGIAAFKEKAQPPPPIVEGFVEPPAAARREPYALNQPALAPPSAKSTSGAEAGSSIADAARAAPRDEKLGTGHGAREWSVVSIEPFERASSRPQFTRQIEYDTYANLVASGVIPRYVDPPRHPRPFPTAPDDGDYVPDPPAGF